MEGQVIGEANLFTDFYIQQSHFRLHVREEDFQL